MNAAISKKKLSKKIKAYKKDVLTPVLLAKRYWPAIVIFLVSLFVFFPYSEKNSRAEIYPKIGEVSKETIRAPFEFSVPKTQRDLSQERERISQNILPIFRYDAFAPIKMLADIDTLINAVDKYTTENKEDTVSRTKHIKTIEGLVPSRMSKFFIENPNILRDLRTQISISQKGLLDKIVAESAAKGEELQKQYKTKDYIRSASNFIEIIESLYDDDSTHFKIRTISADSVQSVFGFRRKVSMELSDIYSQSDSNFTPAQISSAIFALTEKIVKPSLIYDENLHKKNLETAFDSISEVEKTIMKGVAIVRQYDPVTLEISRTLEALRTAEKIRLKEEGIHNFRQAVNLAIIFATIICFAVMIIFHTGKYIPQFLSPQRYFLSLSVICAIQFFLMWLTQIIVNKIYVQGDDLLSDTNHLWNIISWSPAFTAILLSSLLFRRQTGFLISIFFSIYFCMVSRFSIVVPLSVLIIGGFISYYSQKIKYRRHLLWMVGFMMLANIIIGFMLNFANNTFSLQTPFTLIVAPCLSVVISAAVVYLTLPLFEYLFGVITISTLLELADMSNPLLKRLAIEAPGTFNHSLAVGNLAELAAARVGANPLLCRVLAYYHDVGKVKNPIYFTENQLDRKNPHDKLTPIRSVKIIIAHIRDGCNLIDEYKISKIIKNGIIQHHGTAPVGFFYQKALEQKKENEEINIQEYSYSGEKPQTKETAILMLADKVEAMSKSIKGESEAELRKKIQDNVRKIVNSGQLDECGLTFKNVFEIVNDFMPALKGIFHERIEYPEDSKNV